MKENSSVAFKDEGTSLASDPTRYLFTTWFKHITSFTTITTRQQWGSGKCEQKEGLWELCTILSVSIDLKLAFSERRGVEDPEAQVESGPNGAVQRGRRQKAVLSRSVLWVYVTSSVGTHLHGT